MECGARGLRRRHVLQEILTVKSDEHRAGQGIERSVKGDNTLRPHPGVVPRAGQGWRACARVEILSEDERQIVLSEETIPEIPLDSVSLEAQKSSGKTALSRR